MWLIGMVRRAAPLFTAAVLLAGCGGAPAAAPASSAAAPASAAAKPASAAAPAGSAAAKPATSAAAKPAGSSAASAAAKPAGSAGASAPASGQIAIKSAYTTTSGTTIPLWVAKEGGDFTAQGLDVSLTLIAPGAPILAAIESGDVPISEAGGQEIVNAEVNGSNLVMVGGFGEKPTNSIYAVAAVKTPQDLKGKTIGVSSIGAVSHVAGQLAVEKLGLKGQVTFLGTGGLPQTIAAIQSGKVDGGVLSPPQTFEAEKQGLHEVVDVGKLGVVDQTSVVVTTRKYLSEHPDIVERYLKAKIAGTHRAYTDKDLTIKTIIKYAKITDPVLAEKTYNYFVDGEMWGKDGFMTDAALQTNLDIAAQNIPKAKDFKPAQMIDETLVKKIKDSGFDDQVWAKKS